MFQFYSITSIHLPLIKVFLQFFLLLPPAKDWGKVMFSQHLTSCTSHTSWNTWHGRVPWDLLPSLAAPHIRPGTFPPPSPWYCYLLVITGDLFKFVHLRTSPYQYLHLVVAIEQVAQTLLECRLLFFSFFFLWLVVSYWFKTSFWPKYFRSSLHTRWNT